MGLKHEYQRPRCIATDRNYSIGEHDSTAEEFLDAFHMWDCAGRPDTPTSIAARRFSAVHIRHDSESCLDVAQLLSMHDSDLWSLEEVLPTPAEPWHDHREYLEGRSRFHDKDYKAFTLQGQYLIEEYVARVPDGTYLQISYTGKG